MAERETEIGMTAPPSDGQMKIIPYDKLIENVPDAEYYDANHVVVLLTDDQVDDLVAKFNVEL